MSGWYDWFEQEIACPECRHQFKALFIEDADIIDDMPISTTSLASGQTECPECKATITDEDLSK